MIQIKISADNERLLRAANTEAELRGAVDLVLERIAQAEVAKEFAKKEPERGSPYNWKKVVSTLRETLGDDLHVPPFPDSRWYQSVFRYAKMYDMQGERLKKLAERVKNESYLKPPFSAQFLMINADRIMSGFYDKSNFTRNGLQAPFKRASLNPLPVPLPSLPDE